MRIAVLVFLSIFSTLSQCQSKSQEANEHKDSSSFCLLFLSSSRHVIFDNFCIRATGSERFERHQLPLLCGNLPSAFLRHVFHTRLTETKELSQPLPSRWGNVGCMWGEADFRSKIVHRLVKREQQLDAPVQHKVILSHLSRN